MGEEEERALSQVGGPERLCGGHAFELRLKIRQNLNRGNIGELFRKILLWIPSLYTKLNSNLNSLTYKKNTTPKIENIIECLCDVERAFLLGIKKEIKCKRRLLSTIIR